MKEVVLVASPRSKVGKGPARQARMIGLIPAVVYGPEIDPISISIESKVFRTAMKIAGTATIIDLDVDGARNKVLVRAIQRDPVTSSVVHVDFHAIAMNKPIHLSIPIEFVGIPRGVKTDGGIMQATLRELAISCLPANIPEKIEINVEDLGIGDSVHVSDISIDNVEIMAEGRRTVVVISAPTVIKSATEEAEEGEEGIEGEEGEVPAEGAEETPDGEKKEGASE